MDNRNLFSTNYPTTPVQDKFGQIIVQFGASKIEAAVIQIAAALVSNEGAYRSGNLLPETIAEESYNVAVACFEKVHEEFLKASAGVASAGAPLDLVKP
jgi:hypothetical protein